MYFKKSGYCTRCGEPFGGNATAYMVRELVVWAFRPMRAEELYSYRNAHGGDPDDPTVRLEQRETVPVCDACVTEAELADATIDATCGGCGQRMRLSQWPYPHWGVSRCRSCSDRCAQRARRRQRRAELRAVCAVCNETFSPRRADARFCSDACRQKAYRQRGGENRPIRP
jgi:hypothetical protein